MRPDLVIIKNPEIDQAMQEYRQKFSSEYPLFERSRRRVGASTIRKADNSILADIRQRIKNIPLVCTTNRLLSWYNIISQ